MTQVLKQDYSINMEMIDEICCGVVDERGSIVGYLHIPTGYGAMYGITGNGDEVVGYALNAETLKATAEQFELELPEILTEEWLNKLGDEGGQVARLFDKVGDETIGFGYISGEEEEDENEDEEDEDDGEEYPDASLGDPECEGAEDAMVEAIRAALAGETAE